MSSNIYLRREGVEDRKRKGGKEKEGRTGWEGGRRKERGKGEREEMKRGGGEREIEIRNLPSDLDNIKWKPPLSRSLDFFPCLWPRNINYSSTDIH